jgi:hypothetical protein
MLYVPTSNFFLLQINFVSSAGFNSLLRAASSFSTDKLSKIIDDIKTDADDIQKLAPIIEARMAKGERENNELERFKAGLHRLAEGKDRQENAEWREQQKVDRQGLYTFRHIGGQ